MASSLTWLDFSEYDRRRALDVIDLFRERDTRDELGIGTVRDAISDTLFPGTSTLQTRARYFLFIPWIYRKLEARKLSAADVARVARREEINLIKALETSGETEGVIGIEARETLKRLPSSIYWMGLGSWGLRLLDASQADYHRQFGRFSSRADGAALGDGDTESTASGTLWHRALPAPPADFPSAASFALRREEAAYLRERVMTRQPGTLLAYLMDRGQTSEVDYPWEHPQVSDFPLRNRNELEHARLFSLAIHGAALIYNYLLAGLSKRQELADAYRDAIAEWAADMEQDRASLTSWSRQAFWALARARNPRLTRSTQAFVDTWLDLALNTPPSQRAKAEDLADAQGLIRAREARLKGGLSRFTNARALELWSGASGVLRNSYRWFRAQAIVNDVVRGLGRA